MIVRQPRASALRHNALESMGSETVEGRVGSRAEALRVGLCASAIVAEDAALVQRRGREFFRTLRPQNHFHCWLVTQIALLSIRIDRCARTERRVRDKVAMRAELLWDDDRRLEATLLGEQLANRPEVVVDQLRRTLHGCEWLMGRWAMLAHAADVKGHWTAEQSRLAFDLLGTPAEFREGHGPGALLDFDGKVIEGSADPAGVARREIAALKERRTLVEGLDAASRALTVADLGDDTDPELRRLRRHESALQGRLRWCLGQLRYQSPEREPYRGLMESWLGSEEPAPELKPEAPRAQAPALPQPRALVVPEVEETTPGGRFPMVHPPFDLEPEELPADGEPLDIPMILANRRAKKLRQADARREARRREVDRLRA